MEAAGGDRAVKEEEACVRDQAANKGKPSQIEDQPSKEQNGKPSNNFKLMHR